MAFGVGSLKSGDLKRMTTMSSWLTSIAAFVVLVIGLLAIRFSTHHFKYMMYKYDLKKRGLPERSQKLALLNWRKNHGIFR